VVEVVRDVYRGWRDHRTTRLGAALAYYGLFALVPLVTVVVVVADLLVSDDAAVTYLAAPLAELLGQGTDEVALALADRVADARSSSMLGVIGLLSLVMSASLLFVAFQDALNMVWGVPVRPGIQHSVRRRLFAFVVVLGASAVVTVSIAVDSVVAWFRDSVAGETLGFLPTTQVVSRLLPLVVAAFALALLYRLLPFADVDTRAAAVSGALAAVVMWLAIGVIGLALGRTASVSAQGAAGTVFVLLSGFYVLSQIALIGGEMSRALTQRWRASDDAGSDPARPLTRPR
jgi:membrane protein